MHTYVCMYVCMYVCLCIIIYVYYLYNHNYDHQLHRLAGSFLDGRSLCVVHGSSRSQWVPAPHGLPHRSVLAPLLYIIYTSELGPLLTDCALLSQLYADDVQAYMHCLASDAMAAVQAMTLATGALVAWMSSNRLR